MSAPISSSYYRSENHPPNSYSNTEPTHSYYESRYVGYEQPTASSSYPPAPSIPTPTVRVETSPVPSGRKYSETKEGQVEGSPKRAMKSRLSHLLSEQKRRASIRDGFDTLRTVLPTCHAGTSKVEILSKAYSKITKLEKKRKRHEQLKQALQTCINRLEGHQDTPSFALNELRQLQRSMHEPSRSERSSTSDTLSGEESISETSSP